MLQYEQNVTMLDSIPFENIPVSLSPSVYYKISRDKIDTNNIQIELKRLNAAIQKSCDAVQAEMKQLQSNGGSELLDDLYNEEIILKDPVFKTNIEKIISADRYNAEWAVVKELTELLTILQGIYSRTVTGKGRHIKSAGNRILKHLMMNK